MRPGTMPGTNLQQVGPLHLHQASGAGSHLGGGQVLLHPERQASTMLPCA